MPDGTIHFTLTLCPDELARADVQALLTEADQVAMRSVADRLEKTKVNL